MIKHLAKYPELDILLPNILFNGMEYAFNAYNAAINIGTMFGFLKESDGKTIIANRIFEMHLYQFYLSREILKEGKPYFPTSLSRESG